MKRLGVNIDHVATLRNARNETHPSPLKAAKLAIKYGADSITIHLREDRRHIKYLDLSKIKKLKKVPLNLEIATTSEMLKIAIKNKPNYVCLVPEKRKEITTEGGLDVLKNKKKISYFVKKLKKNNVKVSIFVDPNINQISTCKDLKVCSVELHTGEFCDNKKNKKYEYEKLKKSAIFTKKNNLECHAGHGISYKTVEKIAKITEITELNIGHFIIGEAVFIGLKKSILKMRKIIDNSRKKNFYLKSA